MKIIGKKIVNLVVWALIAVTWPVGCVPISYPIRHAKTLIQTSLPVIREFLAEHCGEYELGEFHMQEAHLQGHRPEEIGRYGSNVVGGSYTTAGNTWDLIYDRETGDFYIGELLEKLREQEEARFLEYLKDELPEEDLWNFDLASLDIGYLVQSHNIRVYGRSTPMADTYFYTSHVLPAGITEEDLPEFAARGFDGGIVSWIVCHYYSDRADALTEEAFEHFFADNPAYRNCQYFFIYNDNPSAKEEGTDVSGSDAQNVPESPEETWFRPEPAGKDADCRIEYENGIPLARRPHFTESDGIVTMRFNGIDWYRVRVIRIEDAEKYFPDEEMLAQSSNLKVFPSYENQEFEYSCVFIPRDGSDFAFLYETYISPEVRDFGFRDCIHYYAGGEEVFPDMELE
jgi:hypothetical protein